MSAEHKDSSQYVSRGGLKIEGAAKKFKIDFKGKTVCDVGASTGGFTDFALQMGAKKVYAIDVGYGQLEYKLRIDPRVVVMERTNIRFVKSLPEPIEIFLIDVSFISLKTVLLALKKIILNQKKKAKILALVKPQFEADRKTASRMRGVIKDELLRQQIIEDTKKSILDMGYKIINSTDSVLAGPKGNKEHFLFLDSNK